MLFDARIHINPRKRYLEFRRTTDPRGNYLATVHGIESSGFCGEWLDGKLFVPDLAAIRAALPSRWHKAFDRRDGLWWSRSDNRASITLKTLRGELIGTIEITKA